MNVPISAVHGIWYVLAPNTAGAQHILLQWVMQRKLWQKGTKQNAPITGTKVTPIVQ